MRTRGKANCGLRIADWGLCKTNPIRNRRDTPQRSTGLSFHHSNPMPIVQNEPNSGLGVQLPAGRNVQNEPNFGRGFECDVSSVKSGKPALGLFPLQTLHSELHTAAEPPVDCVGV